MGSYYGDNNEREIINRERRRMLAMRDIDDLAAGKFSGVRIVDRTISKALVKIKKKVKSHFGIEIKVNADTINNKNLDLLYEWIGNHSPRAHELLTKTAIDDEITHRGRLVNNTFFFKIDQGTYAWIRIGDDYRDLIMDDGGKTILLTDEKIKDNDMLIYIFGKKMYQHVRNLNKILTSRENNTLRIYKISGDPNSRSDVAFKSLYQDGDRRELDTIFMEDGVIESITNHIDKYMANKDLYTGRGIIYKTGILLYGEPGTGKTSLIKALASKYGRDLILLDMSTFQSIGLETFVHSVNIDDKKYIIALEDIDCVIADRENENADKDDKKVINMLLQLLDSNSSPNEVIFIASTNHIELLDEALMREGRFDLRVPITGIYEEKAREMCKSFDLNDYQIDEIIDQLYQNDAFPVRQSKLQSIILKHSGMNLRGEVAEEDETGKEAGDKSTESSEEQSANSSEEDEE